MGKNYSANNLGQRKANDFYETPYSITQQFLDAERLSKNMTILEPAAGGGAIVKVLRENGYSVISKSLEMGDDFLTERDKFDAIVTNPPFSLAHAFIVKAKQVSPYFAFLLPLSYLHGKKRFDEIYSDDKLPLSRVYVFTRYPMLGDALRDDGRYRTGMMVYAWFVWDAAQSKGPPTIGWIDNHQFVLGSK